MEKKDIINLLLAYFSIPIMILIINSTTVRFITGDTIYNIGNVIYFSIMIIGYLFLIFLVGFGIYSLSSFYKKESKIGGIK